MVSSDDAGKAVGRKVSVRRFAVTGALTAAIFFVICWLGAFIPGTPGHMYQQLFTTVQPSSVVALIQGVCVSLVVGLVFGVLISVIYNALAIIE